MKPLTISMTLTLLLTARLSLPTATAQEKKGDQPAPQIERVPEIAHADPDDRGKVLGKYLKPAEGEVSVVLTTPVGKGEWLQLTPNQPVKSGQSYLALPGCRGELQLDQIKLTLAGLLPEIVPFPSLLESMIDLHQHEKFALDFTLRKGRIVLTAEAEKPMVRIRFENPFHPEQGEIIDMILLGKGTQVLIDRGGAMRAGKHFFKNPNDVGREPPGAFLGIWVLKGSAAARQGTVGYALTEPPGSANLVWSSLGGLKTPSTVNKLPTIVSLSPPMPDETDKDRRKLRDDILKARDSLAREPAGKPIKDRLAGSAKSKDPAQRIMAGRCYAALGYVPELLESMIEESDAHGWLAGVASVKHWMAMSRDNEYKVYDALQKTFKKGESFKIMELLHGLAKPDALVEFLDNEKLTIRQLAHLNLCEVLPKGKEIRYDPTMPAQQRQAAQKEWLKLLEKLDKK